MTSSTPRPAGRRSKPLKHSTGAKGSAPSTATTLLEANPDQASAATIAPVIAPGAKPARERWFESSLRLNQIGALSAALGAASVVVGVCVYLKNQLSSPELKIAVPAVIELRCSSVDFDAALCDSDQRAGDVHASVTGAFRMEASGPQEHSVSIDKAWAQMKVGTRVLTLQAFWSMNLTPGNEASRRQVVPVSLNGGQAVSQELWFMPLQTSCSEEATPGCTERQNFRPWVQFVAADIRPLARPTPTTSTSAAPASAASSASAGGSSSAPKSVPRGTVNFHFLWSKKGEPEVEPMCVPCTFELGDTVWRAVDRQGPTRVTVTCLQALKRAARDGAPKCAPL